MAKNYSVRTSETAIINVASATAINFTPTGTYTWIGRAKIVRQGATSNTCTFVYKAVDATSGYQMGIQNNNFFFQERKGNTFWSQNNTLLGGLLNRWIDWAITYDGTGQAIHFYLNGVEQLSAIGSFSWSNVTSNTATAMTFGKAATGENLYGNQYAVAMYTRVLSITEIRNFGMGIIPTSSAVYMPCQDGQGTTLTDSSGNANTCTLSSSAQWSFDNPQKNRPVSTLATTNALSFAAATATPSLTLNNPAAMKSLTACTVECMVRIPLRPTAQSNRVLFYNGANTGYLMLINTTGTLRFDIGNSTTIPSTTSSLAIIPGEWNHVAGTWDGTTIRVYVNGTLDTTTNALSGGNSGDPAVNVVIGNANTNDRAVQGQMQELRISNIARYTTNNFVPQTTPFTSDGNTVALWHLGDGSGTAPVDSGPNGLTLAMAGTTNPIWGLGYLKKLGATARNTASGRHTA